MTAWFNDGGDIVFPPKVGGDPITVTPLDIKRVEYSGEDEGKNYKKLVNGKQVNFGYRDEFRLENGKTMPCNTWKLYFAISESGANPGDTIKISHPERGKYSVEVIKQQEKTEWETEEEESEK